MKCRWWSAVSRRKCPEYVPSFYPTLLVSLSLAVSLPPTLPLSLFFPHSLFRFFSPLSRSQGCNVEQAAGGPVVDASYSACGFFTGQSAGDNCGWSDHISIKCAVTMMPKGEAHIAGPCSNNKERGLPPCGDLHPAHNVTATLANEMMALMML